MKRASARDVALQVLTACRLNNAWADAALRSKLGTAELTAADAALCSRIVYGVLQNRMLLDYDLAAYCTQRLEKLQPPLADILRIGAYQILFLNKVPVSAAVNESVELAKRNGRASAAGLVNAVLRRLAQQRQALPPLPRDPINRLTIAYSHPNWLVERMIGLLGSEEAERYLQSNNEIAPVTVQINPLRTDKAALMAELSDCGVQVQEHPWIPDCLSLSSTGDLTALEAFQSGKFLVQDGAAYLAAGAAGVQPGQRVLDVCAAPGGKSFAMAFGMADQGSILSCDLHENKLKRIREGAQRLGITCIETAAADGRTFHPEWEAAFDTVVCDVPCSGLGIIRKKPDIRYKDPQELAALPNIQRAIVDNSARYVKTGGTLIYSTCTVLPEENEHVTDGFLSDHPEFSYEAFTLPARVGTVPGYVTLWPQRHDTDGFFICRMRRREHD
ncbi:MAG: 16S rRNA (cytosine(967)-C(5))-methyltransferase RsmB [Oscillospiraceae bacterium]|nr:16S rRNA (cytosine(967)-C(5))-methyltransferase RsmB [Oscillospiraceae bacterium]